MELKFYPGYRFPATIINYAVWLYHRFKLSFRDIEEMLLYRGIVVTYETIRQWCLKLGKEYADLIRKKQPKRGDKWHLDEVCLNMNGQKYWLWRAVDQEGYELDILVQKRRNKRAAKRFFKKLLKGLKYEPRVLITDKLKSYAAAKKEVMPKVEHRQHKYLNNRAENSHQPTRNKEKQMRRFKSPQQAQRLLYPMGQIHNLFKTHRHKVNANQFRIQFLKAKREWQNITLPLCA